MIMMKVWPALQVASIVQVLKLKQLTLFNEIHLATLNMLLCKHVVQSNRKIKSPKCRYQTHVQQTNVSKNMKRYSLRRRRHITEKTRKRTQVEVSSNHTMNKFFKLNAQNHVKGFPEVIVEIMPDSDSATSSAVMSEENFQGSIFYHRSDLSDSSEINAQEFSHGSCVNEKSSQNDLKCDSSQYVSLRSWLNTHVSESDHAHQCRTTPIVRKPIKLNNRKNSFTMDQQRSVCTVRSSEKTPSNFLADQATDVIPLMFHHTTPFQGSSDTSTPTSCDCDNVAKRYSEQDLFGFENLLKPCLQIPPIQNKCALSPIPLNDSLFNQEKEEKKEMPLQQSQTKKKTQYDRSIIASSYVLSKPKQRGQMFKTKAVSGKENNDIVLFGDTDSVQTLDDNENNVHTNNIFEFPNEKIKKVPKNSSTKPIKKRKPFVHVEPPDVPWQEIMEHKLIIE